MPAGELVPRHIPLVSDVIDFVTRNELLRCQINRRRNVRVGLSLRGDGHGGRFNVPQRAFTDRPAPRPSVLRNLLRVRIRSADDAHLRTVRPHACPSTPQTRRRRPRRRPGPQGGGPDRHGGAPGGSPDHTAAVPIDTPAAPPAAAGALLWAGSGRCGAVVARPSRRALDAE